MIVKLSPEHNSNRERTTQRGCASNVLAEAKRRGRRAESRLVRLWRVARVRGIVIGLALCGPSWAQSDVATTQPACSARLVVHVDVATEISGCPTDVEVATWIDELAAEHVAISASRRDAELAACAPELRTRNTAQDVLVRVELASPELGISRASESAADHIEAEPRAEALPELAAFVVLPTKGTPELNTATARDSQPMRTLVQRVSCNELLRVAALSVSLIVTPEPLPKTDTFGAEPLVGAEPESERLVMTGSSSEPIIPQPSAAAGLSDVSPKTQARPERTPSSDDALRFALGARASAGGGLNPGFNLGADGFLGIGVAPWWLEVYASYASSAKGSIVRDAGLAGSVRSRTLEFALLPCRRWATGYQVCAEAGYVMFAAEGRGFDANRDDNLNFWGVGGQASYAWPVLGALSANLGLAVLVPLSRVDMRVSGVVEPVWQMPVLTARGAFGLEWR